MSVRLEIVVCEGPTCSDRAGGPSLRAGLCRYLEAQGLAERVHVERTICFGECGRAPNLLVCPVTGDGVRVDWTHARLAGGAGGTLMVHGLSEATLGSLESVLAAYLDPAPGAARGAR
jgi:hypothetical protein